MSFNEYKSEVSKRLLNYGYTTDEIKKFVSRPKIDKVLRTNYERYTEKHMAGCEPIATASCLDMMYE